MIVFSVVKNGGRVRRGRKCSDGFSGHVGYPAKQFDIKSVWRFDLQRYS